MPLQLDDLYELCDLWTEDDEELLARLGLEVSTGLAQEFEAASRAIAFRASQTALNYPLKFDIAPRTERLLFDLVRSARPTIVVETGIANGRSTAILLAAMDLNQSGELHSVDIAKDVGALVPLNHGRWHKYITSGSTSDLRTVFDSIPSVDLFIHDGDHSYGVQAYEYDCALEHAAPRALIASDDVNFSYAFHDFCARTQLPALILSDVNKCFGVVRVP